MAKLVLHPFVEGLRGNFGGMVFKRYGGRVVVSKYPDMSRVKRTAKQKAQLDRMRWAARFYRHVLSDPALQARFAKLAEAKESTLHRLATKEYMRVSKVTRQVRVTPATVASMLK